MNSPSTAAFVAPPSRCTCFQLRRLSRTITRLYDQALAETGLKTTQYSLLLNTLLGPMPMSTLADLLGVERTTLTRNLKPLIESGWITLESGPDARQRVVTLTDTGRDKVLAARDAWRRAQHQVRDTLGADFVHHLHAQIATALNQLHPLIEES